MATSECVKEIECAATWLVFEKEEKILVTSNTFRMALCWRTSHFN